MHILRKWAFAKRELKTYSRNLAWKNLSPRFGSSSWAIKACPGSQSRLIGEKAQQMPHPWSADSGARGRKKTKCKCLNNQLNSSVLDIPATSLTSGFPWDIRCLNKEHAWNSCEILVSLKLPHNLWWTPAAPRFNLSLKTSSNSDLAHSFRVSCTFQGQNLF